MNFDKVHLSLHSPIINKRTKQLFNREDTLNLSPILNETSLFKTLNDSSLRQVLDESSMIAPTNAGETLNEAFFEILQSSRPTDILDTLKRLVQVCCDSLELVEPWNRYNVHNCWLAEEANTWKLLHCLYSDSITDHADSIDNIVTEPTLSQQVLVNALFKCDLEVRLLQLLVDWLESTAAYQEEATKTTAPIISNTIHWGKTLHQLLIGSSLFNKERSKAMITCIDPDAPRRQKKSIHSDDLQDDNDLCKRIFTEVRCGKFNEALSLCLKAGQAWRGAALQGWRLLHYEPRQDTNMSLEITGNPSRDLWKWCALGIATNPSENSFYRATVGILCGHLQSAISVCQGNWEDLLWAHLRVQIETRVDKFLQEHHATALANTTPLQVQELLQSELKIQELSLQQVFSEVTSLLDGKKESRYQTCQKHLMLGHIRAIMQDSLQWLDIDDIRFIRFLAHLVLILRQMGKDPQHDIGNKILEKYVTLLIEQCVEGAVDCPALIAYYCSTLPSENQKHSYASLMDRVYKSSYRDGVVKAGVNAGIEVGSAARLTVKKAITDIQQGYGNLDATITQTSAIDKDKTLITKSISTLEWLALIEDQTEEALWLCNAMIRTFIFISNTDAAASCIVNLNQYFPNLLKQVPSNSSELREHLCLKAYLEALDGFATWYRQYISGQPKDVEDLPPDATFTDKVHHEQRCAQVQQQKARWENAIAHQSRHTKNLLYNVLLFPGGWLQDETECISSSNFNEEEKKDRIKQCETLRRLCIPEVTILILKILQSTDDVENHKEAIKLSNLIAAENRGLYKTFGKEKLLEVLERINKSSILLLEKDHDIFGCDEISDN